MTPEESIQRQEARKCAEMAFFKREGKAKPRTPRITRDDVNAAVSQALRDASREVRQQIKITPGWGRALCWASAELEKRAAIDSAREALQPGEETK